MALNILKLIQGSVEWLEAAPKYNRSSEAAAMLSLDQNLPRHEYIRMRATGDVKAFTEWEQKHLLDKGKEIEGFARDRLEHALGKVFYPIVANKGRLLASFDGIDLDDSEKEGFECKMRNAQLLDYIIERKDLPDSKWPQVEQQLYVGELDFVHFIVADENANIAHLTYHSHPERRARLLDGWVKVSEEIANYVHVDKPASVVGSNLPSVTTPDVQVVGEVKKSNIIKWKADAFAVFNNVKLELATDQDFADAEKTVKWCGEVEAKCKLLEELILGQMVPVQEQVQMLREIDAESARIRILLGNTITDRKQNIRGRLVNEGKAKLSEHIRLLNIDLGGDFMPLVPADFGEKMKGKRTIDTLTQARDAELLRATAAATEAAKVIKANLAALDAVPKEFAGLFPDRRALAQNSVEYVATMIDGRIAKHKQGLEDKRRAEEAAAQRERERAEAQKQAELQRQQSAMTHIKQTVTTCNHRILKGGVCTGCGEVVAKADPIDTALKGFGARVLPPRQRPTDEQLLAVAGDAIAREFSVAPDIAAEWLQRIDWAAVTA